MPRPIILASASKIRADLLSRAGIDFELSPVRVDEEAIIAAMVAEGVDPDQIADALANAKAEKASRRAAGALVIGCDQVLAMDGRVFQKAADVQEAQEQLRRLQDKTHHLYSAAVMFLDSQPIWRHTGHVRLTMRDLSDAQIAEYLARNWDRVRHSVGCYHYEEEGVRLFLRVEGDFFHVLGLPLREIVDYLITRQEISV